ncbi:pyrroline-5-carboxylate reductase [Acetanaerobacterium elongatum]|uniref:Pyrroline-5-carboxylate reductase n=1 Tax=Acetanaerobacterium elongatum TaxID=258515 RepID=A0A1H0BC21_9FIRM|nr:pyrroline-5-carboxylate reductase [Acetanaerobacterium elongatum]SDN43214.1 pyrroline-5-carboxylate reductase [Acetanaerobacterium elongatum]
MSATFKVGFIGLGNMASAIIGGILAKEVVSPSQICAYDVSSEKCAAFAEKGLSAAKSEQEVVAQSKYVFLCVKPQVITDVLTALKPAAGEHNVFVSIAAGVGAQYIKNIIGFDCKLVLVMPNTPLMLGEGASALACIPPTGTEDFIFVKSIFASAGISEEIPADKLCEVIPVNGSSPAFIYLFAKIVAEFSKEQGIDYDVALRLFSQTLIGSAKMLTESKLTPDELIKMVSSPGGTTLKALSTFEEYGFEKTVRAAMRSCIDRAYELGR